MIDEAREGLFDRTFLVIAEIRHPNNSTKLADNNSIRPASLKRLTEMKEAVPAWARYISDTNGKLKIISLSGILSIMKAAWTAWEWMNFW